MHVHRIFNLPFSDGFYRALKQTQEPWLRLPTRLATNALLALVLLTQPLLAGAQQAEKIPQIGILRLGSPPDAFVEAFREGLRDLGYVEGRTIVLTLRWAEGSPQRLPALAAELVRLNVDVIVTSQTPPALAAKEATGAIPIVVAAAADPVGAGLVDSLARPGRNITGLTLITPELEGKRLELLKEAIPRVSSIAMLTVPDNPGLRLRVPTSKSAADKLGFSLQVVNVQHPFDFEGAFAALKKDGVGALLVPAFFTATVKDRESIVQLAARNRLPVLYDTKEFVEAGGLMAYGPSVADSFRRAATYVDKILKGAKPATLPMEQPSKFELVINVTTAKALGLTMPPSIMLQAERLIE